MRPNTRNPGDSLVKLYLVSPFNLDPPPDRGQQGRLDRVLKSVGAKSHLSVRARMITAVSNTKFKTHEGLPVSLVGLHGKDELLVLGPDWAIENLGRGEEPDKDEIGKFIANCRASLKQDLRLASEVQKAIFFIRDNSRRFSALESRSEFRTMNDGWGHKPLPQFIHIPFYGQDNKSLQVEYEELLSLRAAIKFARRYFDNPDPTKEEFLNSTETVLPLWIASIHAAIESLDALHADCEIGKHPWWFTWTKGWLEEKRRIAEMVSNNRPKAIRSPGMFFVNGEEFIAYQKYTGLSTPET